MDGKQRVLFEDLGTMDYQSAWDHQDRLMQANLALKAGVFAGEEKVDPLTVPTTHHLLFVEHPPVYTLGKSGKMEHVLIDEAQRAEKGIAFYQTNRGGDITFHGPDQVVGYPIFDLEKFYTDIGRYLRELEEVIIRTLADYGIAAGRSAGETGVWIDVQEKGRERKICAMGVRCSRWITMHGFALNVNTDLGYFNHIVPCGIQNKTVTSMKEELGKTVSVREVKERLKAHMQAVFNVVLEEDQNARDR
jgi:lipoyl(octanoyl) transferase